MQAYLQMKYFQNDLYYIKFALSKTWLKKVQILFLWSLFSEF
jgi:hypothetical protein